MAVCNVHTVDLETSIACWDRLHPPTLQMKEQELDKFSPSDISNVYL